MYRETFYGHHTAQHQLLQSKKSQKGLTLETKNTQKLRKSEIWWSLFICNTVLCAAVYAPLAPAKAEFDFQNNQDALNDPKGNKI